MPVFVPAGQLQQSLLAFGRSTRKLMRDVMEEQQRALDVLSSQVNPCFYFMVSCRVFKGFN